MSYIPIPHHLLAFPGGARGKEPACQFRRHKTWVPSLGRKIPWRRAWQPTPIFLPGESHGQRSLAGYSPQVCKEADTVEATEPAHIHARNTESHEKLFCGGEAPATQLLI